MRIIGKMKDYYDNVAHIYGADPLVVYVRGNLTVRGKDGILPDLDVEMHKDEYHGVTGGLGVHHADEFYGHLVICGKVYDLVSMRRYEFSEPFKLEVYDPYRHKIQLPRGWGRIQKPEEYVATSERHVSPGALAISKKIGQPVFIIKREDWNSRKDRTVTVEGRYFPLADMGVPRFYPAEQIYQDISYFIANTMNDCPDTQPAGAPPQTDKEKIVAHGLDLKQSFRHRK